MSARLEPPHTVGGAIARRARRMPEKLALVGIGEPGVSFARLAAAISSAREELAAAGLTRTDRVGLMVQPGVAGAQLLVSLACNVVAVPLDRRLTAAQIAQVVEAKRITAFARLRADGTLELARLAPGQATAASTRPTSFLDVALLLDAPVTHRQLRALAAEMGLERGLALGRNDRAGCMLELHYPGIAASLFAPLILGASVGFGQRIELLEPTLLCVTSQSLKELLARVSAEGKPMSHSVRCVLCAADSLAQDERGAAEALLNVPVYAIPNQPRVANSPGAEVARAGSSDDLLELEVHAIWKRLLQRDDIGLDEHFFVAGGDSLLATQMLLEVERLIGRSYPNSDLSALTIRHIAQVLRHGMPEPHGCVTRVKSGSGIALFFCHGDYQARGLYAHQLAEMLPDHQALYLLHPEREPPVGTSVEVLAARYLEEVLPMTDGSPVMVGGYCNGGYLAWHLAHLLRARGVVVAGMLLVDTPSFNARPLARRMAGLLRVTSALLPGRAAWRAQELAMRALWSLYRDGLTGFVRRLSRAVREQLKTHSTPRADASWWLFVRAMATRYVPPPIDVDVYCILSGQGPRRDTDPECWQPLASSVAQISVPGTHLSMIISHRPALAAALARAIRDVSARRLVGARAAAERPQATRLEERARAVVSRV